MVKKVYKYENAVTLYVKARSPEKALEKLNKRLNRITNQDVFYMPNSNIKESVISDESLKEDIKQIENSDIIIESN